DAVIEWALQHWRPRVVASENGSGVVRDLSDGGEVDDFQQRVGRRFCPGQFCIWAQRFFYRGEIAHVDEIDLKSPAHENFADQLRRAVIRVDVREDVIARG